MKFYGEGKVVRYDPKTKKTTTVCRFEGGCYETDDEATIKLLKGLNFKHSGTAAADAKAKAGKENKNVDKS